MFQRLEAHQQRTVNPEFVLTLAVKIDLALALPRNRLELAKMGKYQVLGLTPDFFQVEEIVLECIRVFRRQKNLDGTPNPEVHHPHPSPLPTLNPHSKIEVTKSKQEDKDQQREAPDEEMLNRVLEFIK